MTSDEKRREVAERLRNASARRGDAPWMVEDLMQALGFRCYEDGEDQLFARLADLIDRPKAKRDDAGNYWRCGHCGAFSRKDAVTNCFGVIPSRRCGHCGREWER